MYIYRFFFSFDFGVNFNLFEQIKEKENPSTIKIPFKKIK